METHTRTNWEELTDRNIGVLSHEQQEKLKTSCVAVFGVGGLGGVVCEVLCRSGVGRMKIVDNGSFEPSNLNRQVFCFRSTLDRKKVDVTKDFLLDINPGLQIDTFEREDSGNIEDILTGVDVAVLTVDMTRACLVVSRAARKMGIPLVEGWAIAFTNARVLTNETPSLEEVYGLPTIGKSVEDITEEEYRQTNLIMLQSLLRMEGLEDYYTPEAMGKVMEGNNPSFAPLVWLPAVTIALEAIKVLLDWGTIALAPKFAIYDPLKQKIPKQK